MTQATNARGDIILLTWAKRVKTCSEILEDDTGPASLNPALASIEKKVVEV